MFTIPQKLYAPKSVPEIQYLVKQAKQLEQTIRVVGCGRANNISFRTGGFILSLHRMNSIGDPKPLVEDARDQPQW